MFCQYCCEPMAPRLTRYGRVHQMQPRACCKSHSQRLQAWDRWIEAGRNVRAGYDGHRPAPKLPSMPPAEAVQMFQL